MRQLLTALSVAALAACTTSNPDVVRRYETQRLSQVYDATVLSVRPVTGGEPLRESQDVRVILKITDQLTGKPLAGLYPGGWMDRAAVRRKLGLLTRFPFAPCGWEGDCRSTGCAGLGVGQLQRDAATGEALQELERDAVGHGLHRTVGVRGVAPGADLDRRLQRRPGEDRLVGPDRDRDLLHGPEGGEREPHPHEGGVEARGALAPLSAPDPTASRLPPRSPAPPSPACR